MSDNLWQNVGACFDTDDGSLPGIEVAQLSAEGVTEVYAMLRRRSRLATEVPEFWNRFRGVSVPVDSVPNAAAMVVSGEAEAFHHGIAGVVSVGVELPALGVFVWPDAIELDYQMGQDWGTFQIAGFFELLWDCCTLDPAATVTPADFEGPPYPDQFEHAWASFVANRSR